MNYNTDRCFDSVSTSIPSLIRTAVRRDTGLSRTITSPRSTSISLLKYILSYLIPFFYPLYLRIESNYFNSSIVDPLLRIRAIEDILEDKGGKKLQRRDRNEAFTLCSACLRTTRRREKVSSIQPIPTDVGQSPVFRTATLPRKRKLSSISYASSSSP